jgi:3-deoxy-D-manno-octulosonate 8-phosphate phosphatase (KDO 8-P phosphatase)
VSYPDLESVPGAVLDAARQVRLACFDVDGVLTDGRVWLNPQGGELTKGFHVHDGLGLKLLDRHGISVALITTRQSGALAERARELGIRHLYQAERDKLARLDSVCESLGLALEQVAYVGDDLPDLAPMARVGLAIAVANAHPWVLERAHFTTARAGGDGAAREVADLLLAAQGKSGAVLAQALSRS